MRKVEKLIEELRELISSYWYLDATCQDDDEDLNNEILIKGRELIITVSDNYRKNCKDPRDFDSVINHLYSNIGCDWCHKVKKVHRSAKHDGSFMLLCDKCEEKSRICHSANRDRTFNTNFLDKSSCRTLTRYRCLTFDDVDLLSDSE